MLQTRQYSNGIPDGDMSSHFTILQLCHDLRKGRNHTYVYFRVAQSLSLTQIEQECFVRMVSNSPLDDAPTSDVFQSLYSSRSTKARDGAVDRVDSQCMHSTADCAHHTRSRSRNRTHKSGACSFCLENFHHKISQLSANFCMNQSQSPLTNRFNAHVLSCSV